MKKFLLKILPYCIAILSLFGLLGFFADGNTDDNYMHFSVEKPENIILGDSRGAQAVVPGILNKKLNKKFDNFSFNVVESPYGQIYLKALKRKMDPNTQKGTFILTVDPWNLSMDRNVKNTAEYPEENSPLNNMYFYDLSPNYEYLIRNYNRSWFKLYTERKEAGKSNTFLHNDGWLEVTVNMDRDSVNKRTEEKISFYKSLSKKQKLSSDRLQAFGQIIKHLKQKGKVYIVRVPASLEIMNIENEKYPQFNQTIKSLAQNYDVRFFDFSKNFRNYKYTDGNHMYKESGEIFTAQISDSILMKK